MKKINYYKKNLNFLLAALGLFITHHCNSQWGSRRNKLLAYIMYSKYSRYTNIQKRA